MRAFFAFFSLISLGALTACQHFDPMDTVRQEKTLNIAIIHSDTYRLIPNAHCEIFTDNKDKALVTQLNPDALLMDANYKTLKIECQAPGYIQTHIAITNTLTRWSADDLFILPPGEIVDTSSSLLPYYPSHIVVLMNKKPFVFPETVEKNYKKSKENNLLYQGTLA